MEEHQYNWPLPSFLVTYIPHTCRMVPHRKVFLTSLYRPSIFIFRLALSRGVVAVGWLPTLESTLTSPGWWAGCTGTPETRGYDNSYIMCGLKYSMYSLFAIHGVCTRSIVHFPYFLDNIKSNLIFC